MNVTPQFYKLSKKKSGHEPKADIYKLARPEWLQTDVPYIGK